MRVITSNFVKFGQTVAELLRFYGFPTWRPAPSWVFENLNYYLLVGLRDQICVIVQNFIKFGRYVAEIWRFFYFFKMAAVRHVEYLKLRCKMFSGTRSAKAHHRVKFRQNPSNGCGDIAISRFSKTAAAAILDFNKFKFLMAVRLRDQICVIMQNFIKVGRSVAEIWRFFYFSRWQPSAMLDFENCDFKCSPA